MPSLIIIIFGYFRALLGVLKDPAVKGLALFITLYLLFGTFFYHRTEGWSYLDSAYFCVVTLATVGFGDFTPKTSLGKFFTIFYIMIGIGSFVAFATALAQNMVERRSNRRKRLSK